MGAVSETVGGVESEAEPADTLMWSKLAVAQTLCCEEATEMPMYTVAAIGIVADPTGVQFTPSADTNELKVLPVLVSLSQFGRSWLRLATRCGRPPVASLSF